MRETMITSSILILCIALLRKLCKGRISACLQYALWLIVAVRLMIPGIAVVFPNILPESELSIMNVADRVAAAAQAQTEELENYNVAFGGLPFLNAEVKGGATDFPVSGVMPEWADLFKGLWMFGVVAVGTWMIAVNIVFMRKLRKSRIRYEKEAFELPVPLPVYLAKNLPSPCLYGMPGNQAIYLSENAIEDEEKLKHILAHEYCHYKHRDIFWSALRCMIVAVYWFHPLVWVAAVMSKQDCELACDESAIKLLGEEERVAYGKTLVSLITRKTKASDIVCAATTMTGGTEGVKERVRRIAGQPRRLMIVLIPVAVVVCVVAVLTFTQAKELPNGARILEGESSLTVTTDCFQVAFPDSFAKKTYYCSENDADIIVYHMDSDREIGRFCRLPYEEAVPLVDEKEVILIGNYGSNDALNRYMKGYGMLSHVETFADYPDDKMMHEYHEYQPTEAGQDSAMEHEYVPTEIPAEAGVGGVPGTDSNADSTDYIIHDENVDIVELPAEKIDNIQLPDEGVSHVYLPNERVVSIETAFSTSGTYCYLYIPADNSDADAKVQAELSEMSQKLVELAGYVSVLPVNIE